MPVLQQGDKLVGCSFDMDGEVLRLPIGVFAMIAPFNFPAMVPFWFLPYAIATGNTFVIKTSKQVPMTMQLITEYIDTIGLPPGVFNLVNGDQVVANAFMDSPLVKGVSLVGSTPTCRLVAEKCAQDQQALSGHGCREESPGGDAGRPGEGCSAEHGHLLLRVRRAALHGILGDRGGGRRDV